MRCPLCFFLLNEIMKEVNKIIGGEIENPTYRHIKIKCSILFSKGEKRICDNEEKNIFKIRHTELMKLIDDNNNKVVIPNIDKFIMNVAGMRLYDTNGENVPIFAVDTLTREPINYEFQDVTIWIEDNVNDFKEAYPTSKEFSTLFL